MLFVSVIQTGPNGADVQALRDDAELRRKQEIHEAEESKNAHIQDLMKKHEKVRSDTDMHIVKENPEASKIACITAVMKQHEEALVHRHTMHALHVDHV